MSTTGSITLASIEDVIAILRLALSDLSRTDAPLKERYARVCTFLRSPVPDDQLIDVDDFRRFGGMLDRFYNGPADLTTRIDHLQGLHESLVRESERRQRRIQQPASSVM